MEKLVKVWKGICFAGFLCVFIPVALVGVIAQLASVSYAVGKDIADNFCAWL